jgi:hypothetical protein
MGILIKQIETSCYDDDTKRTQQPKNPSPLSDPFIGSRLQAIPVCEMASNPPFPRG